MAELIAGAVFVFLTVICFIYGISAWNYRGPVLMNKYLLASAEEKRALAGQPEEEKKGGLPLCGQNLLRYCLYVVFCFSRHNRRPASHMDLRPHGFCSCRICAVRTLQEQSELTVVLCILLRPIRKVTANMIISVSKTMGKCLTAPPRKSSVNISTDSAAKHKKFVI